MLLDPIAFSLEVGTNGISISIPFDETAVFFKGQVISPLKGILEIDGTIDQFQKDMTNHLFDIGLIVPPAGVSIKWDTGTSTQNALGALSSADRASMEALIKTGVWAEISSNTPGAGLLFNEDENKDGLLGKAGLRFRSVTVQNIDAHTIGLFCMMILANDTPSSVVRTDPGLPGSLGAALSMSGPTFQQLIFCPGITESLVSKFDPTTQTPDQFAQLVHDKMPPACGTVDYVPLSGGLKLTNILARLENGYVQVNGTAIQGKTDVYCFRLVANFWTHLLLSVKSDGTITASLVPNPPNITTYIDVSWFCVILYFVAAFVLSPIAGFLAVWILFTLDWLANILVPMLAPSLNLGLGQSEQVGLAGFTLQKIDIFSDRLTLLGKVKVATPPTPTLSPGRSVDLAVTDDQATNETEIGSGTYHFPGSKYCKAKDYPYTESTDEEQVTLTATPHFMPQPGDLITSLGVQTTKVSYGLVDPKTLQLTGHGAFNYGVKVTVECDSDENFVATAEYIVGFTNHTIAMGGGFDDDMKKCGMAARLAINLLRTIPQAVPRGGDLTYGEVVQILREAALQGHPGAAEGIATAVTVYGAKVIADILAPPENVGSQIGE
jgi:hypothetical protein